MPARRFDGCHSIWFAVDNRGYRGRCEKRQAGVTPGRNEPLDRTSAMWHGGRSRPLHIGRVSMSDSYISHIQGHGRVSIPAPVRQALNLHPGAELFVSVEDGRVVLTPADAALAHFQQAVADHFSADRDLVAELLADRRAEAARGD